MADRDTFTWDTIRDDREMTERRRSAVIDAMRAAGHDPDFDLYKRRVVCCRRRVEGDRTAVCTAEVDPMVLVDVGAAATAMLDSIRAMTCKPADPPNDHVVRVKLTDGLTGYVDDFGRVYENVTNADWYTAERAAAIAASVSGPMLHRAEAAPLPEHGNDDDDEPIAWLDIAEDDAR